MCFDPPAYLASSNIIADLKQNDPDLENLLQRAKADDGDALFIGSLILLGWFDLAPIDEAESAEWTRRGALAKHPACAVAHGIHVHSGYVTGRSRDADRYIVLGKKWLLDATTDQSQPCALMLRGVVEEYGIGGFRRSKLNARECFSAAAEMGDPFSQFRLAQKYEQESSRMARRDDQNAAAAFRLTQLAAEQGFAAAQVCSVSICKMGSAPRKTRKPQTSGYSRLRISTIRWPRERQAIVAGFEANRYRRIPKSDRNYWARCSIGTK